MATDFDEDEVYPTENVKLYACQICGRSFNGNALRKHQPICQKSNTKKRKTFDSGKQRADGSDVQYDKTRETKKVQVYGEKADIETRKGDWRQKHNELIKAIRQARDVTVAIKTGGPLPTFQPSAIPSDYVQCSFCGRHFNSGAAERHIPFCEQQHKRQKNPSANKTPSSRTKYQAPLPGSRKPSSEQNGYNQYGQSNGSRSGYAASNGGGGSGYGGTGYGGGGGGYGGGANGGGGYSQKALSVGANQTRKPIRYDANAYNDDNDRVVYSIRNKASSNTRVNGRDDQILRTGRNNQNNEINSLARKRSGNNSQKSSPMNSNPSAQSNNRRSPTPTNGRYANNLRGAQKPSGASKFCVECGTQFPVEWAKFCCLCGESRK